MHNLCDINIYYCADFHNNLLTGDFLRLAAQLDLHSLEIHYNLFTGPVPIGLGPMLNAFNLGMYK